jgi:hypothetical protein
MLVFALDSVKDAWHNLWEIPIQRVSATAQRGEPQATLSLYDMKRG